MPKMLNRRNKLGLEVSKKLYILGKNQKWLADQCGCSEVYISRIINGKARPSIEMSEKIAEALGMSAVEIRKMVLEDVA